MNVLRKDRDDENLSTADIVNPVRNRDDAVTPRQAYGSGLEPSHNDNDRLDNPPATGNRAINLPNGSVVTDRQVVRVDRQVLYPEGQASNAARSETTDRPMDARRNDPPDYTPPSQGGPGGQPAVAPRAAQSGPAQVPPVAPVPAPPPAAAASSNPGPVAVPPDGTGPGRPGPLFPDDELHNFRARWDQVQTSFVDEPRKAVESADSLVANVVKRIAEQFANERETLEKQWDRGDSVNTEDLRQALKRYRAFFDRLLAF